MVKEMTQKKNVILDSQILSTLMSCERLTDFRFNQNLQPIGGKGNSLEAGWLLHQYLEGYYKSIRDGVRGKDAIDAAMKFGNESLLKGMDGIGLQNTPVENVKHPNGHLDIIGSSWIIDTFIQYCEYYKNDPWIPIELEKVLSKVVYEDDELRVMWKGKLDMLADTNQGIYPVDHKTTKQNRKLIKLNNQFMGQCVLSNTRMMIRNVIGWQLTAKPKDKFKREPISYTQSNLMEWLDIVVYYARYLIGLNETGYWPPRFSHCDKFNGCIFREVCEADIHMRDEELKHRFVIGEPWDISDGDE